MSNPAPKPKATADQQDFTGAKFLLKYIGFWVLLSWGDYDLWDAIIDAISK